MKKFNFKSFVLGAGATILVGGLSVTALAATGAVTFNASNLSLNGTQISAKGENYTLANGQSVPASITYTDEKGGGTTYLPVRRIAELMGVETGWDGATRSVTVKGEVKTPAETTTPPDAKQSNEGFRSSPWGASISTIKGNETATLVNESGTGALYKGTVSGLNAYISYQVDVTYGLYRGGYVFQEEHSNGHTYISDYQTLKDAVIQTYGAPTSDQIVKLSTLADYADAGQAIEQGYVEYLSEWVTDNSRIVLNMSSDNYKISTVLAYESLSFTPPLNADGI